MQIYYMLYTMLYILYSTSFICNMPIEYAFVAPCLWSSHHITVALAVILLHNMFITSCSQSLHHIMSHNLSCLPVQVGLPGMAFPIYFMLYILYFIFTLFMYGSFNVHSQAHPRQLSSYTRLQHIT